MVKHYSKRASKKRAYKKRRTIRKLKMTMRRKMRMVGGATPEEELIKQLFPLIQQVLPDIFGVFMKNLGPFLQIIMLLAGAGMKMGGSKKRSTQRGGGLSQGTKDRLISKLKTLKTNFEAKEGKEDVVACIDVFINKFEAEQVDSSAPPPPETENITIDSIKNEIAIAPVVPAPDVSKPEVPATTDESKFVVFKRLFSEKVNGLLNRKIESVRSKFTDEEYECLVTLKNAILSDVVTDIRSKIDEKLKFLRNTKDAVLSRVDSLKESGKGLLSNVTSVAIGKGLGFASQIAVGNLKKP
jgi:hypothetical protein